MKKKLIIISAIILLTACSNSEHAIKKPKGTSNTYIFFKQMNYKSNKYTLKLTNEKQDITIINDNNNQYYKAANNIIIQKNGKKYNLNTQDKTYTIEKQEKKEDFAQNYLPLSLKEIKTKKYTKGTKWQGINRYTYEKYNNIDHQTIYYFKGKKLKKITNKTPLDTTTVNFKSITDKIDKSKFKIPKGYQKLSY